MYHFPDHAEVANYKCENGIQIANGKLFGDRLKQPENDISLSEINNGIIVDKGIIKINGYPKYVEKYLTTDLTQNLDLLQIESEYCYDNVLCTTRDNVTCVTKKILSLQEIFTSKITEWDACCCLEYKSYMSSSNKIKLLIKKNEFTCRGQTWKDSKDNLFRNSS